MSLKKKTTKKNSKKKILKKTTTNSVFSSDLQKKVESDIVKLITQARLASVQSVNSIMTATYWEIGRRIVLEEQKGKKKAQYGTKLIKNLAKELTKSFGRGFGLSNLKNFRQFYLSYSDLEKSQTVSGQLSKKLKSLDFYESLEEFSSLFPLPWSSYVLLMSIKEKEARKFYEDEALRGGWSVRQLNRQIQTAFFERTLLSKNKKTMLTKYTKANEEDKMLPEDMIKDPYVLEFLGLKDEYSEKDLEEALIYHLETFLLELGGDFSFVGRQKRLRIDDSWFRVDLIFYHRTLRCLVIIDLKIGDFNHADAGQMNMYLNYAEEHWTKKGENPPIGLILCSGSKKTLVKYTLKGMKKILTANYIKKLPSQKLLIKEIENTKKLLEQSKKIKNR